jgi:ribose transport system substrate-binding protein
MRIPHYLGLWGKLLMLVVLMAGCQRSEPKAATPTGGKPIPNESYYFIGISTSVMYWIDARQGFEERGKQLGVKAVFTGPADWDPAGQARQLDEIISKKPTGIVLCPADAGALKPGIDRAMDAGISVVTVDTDSPQSKRYCYIGTDNYNAGLVVGELLGQALGGKGKVGMCRLVGQWNIEERARGVRDALKKYPDIQIVGEADDKANPAQAPTAVAGLLAAHPEITGMAGLDAVSGGGIARAVLAADKKGKIKIVCFDRDEDMLQYVADGTIEASVAQKTYLMSWLALTLLHALAHDEIKHLPDWRAANAPPLPRCVDTGVMIITKDNYRQFKHNRS